MGAYSPAPVVTPEIHARVMREVINPTLAGMAADGLPYTGFLYAGLMIDGEGQPRVVEFNCRMGDPETQPIMVRLKTDLVDLVEAALAGKLDEASAEWTGASRSASCSPPAATLIRRARGDVISGLEHKSEDVYVFHAGTADKDGAIVTAGGRVLCVTALGDSIREAQNKAYDAIGKIQFLDMQFRHDIGHHAIGRSRS